MKTILMNAQKGGVGKTYIALAMATAAARDGLRTFYIDLDEQQTLRQLVSMRDPSLPSPEQWEEGSPSPKPHEVAAVLDAVRDQFDLCIIDTPGSIQPWNAEMMQLADFIIIPTGATTPDILSIDRTQQLCKSLGKPFAFVLSKTNPRGSRAADVAEQLKAFGHVCSSQIRQRTLHEVSTDTGKTALDSARATDAAAREELTALWTEVKALAGLSKTEEQ